MDEQFVLDTQATIKAKTKKLANTITIGYIVSVTILLVVYIIFLMGLVREESGSPRYFRGFFLFFLTASAVFFVLYTLDALEINSIIKVLKESGIDLKKFAKLSFARVEELKPKKCKSIEKLIENRGSALSVRLPFKFRILCDEAKFCRLAMIAGNPVAEEKFRKELWVRQSFTLIFLLFSIVLGTIAPRSIWLFALIGFIFCVSLISFCIVILVMPKARLRVQAEWLVSIESENEYIETEAVQNEESEEVAETAQSVSSEEEFGDFDLSSFDL